MSKRTPLKSREWRLYLDDMLDGCQAVRTFTSDMTSIEEFTNNRMAYDATLRNLQNIGEAAMHVPDDKRLLLPSIDWRGIIVVRHVLVHGYAVINDTTIWEIIQHRIPDLEAQLGTFLAQHNEGG